MTVERKRAIVASLLGVAFVWPGVHHALYRRYGIDPWKLCGWAMYTRPHDARQIVLLANAEGREERVPLDDSAVAGEVRRLGRLRGALGELQPLDELGAAVLAARPWATRAIIVERRIGLDCPSAHLRVLGTRRYDFERRPSSGR